MLPPLLTSISEDNCSMFWFEVGINFEYFDLRLDINFEQFGLKLIQGF